MFTKQQIIEVRDALIEDLSDNFINYKIVGSVALLEKDEYKDIDLIVYVKPEEVFNMIKLLYMVLHKKEPRIKINKTLNVVKLYYEYKDLVVPIDFISTLVTRGDFYYQVHKHNKLRNAVLTAITSSIINKNNKVVDGTPTQSKYWLKKGYGIYENIVIKNKDKYKIVERPTNIVCDENESVVKFLFGKWCKPNDVLTYNDVLNCMKNPKFKHKNKLKTIFEHTLNYLHIKDRSLFENTNYFNNFNKLTEVCTL